MITRAIDYFLWFEADSRFFAMEEGWHAANQVALIEGRRTFILDKEKEPFPLFKPQPPDLPGSPDAGRIGTRFFLRTVQVLRRA